MKKRILFTLLLTMCLTVICTISVSAADNIRQTGLYQDKIVVSFDKPTTYSGETITGYAVYLSTNDGEYSLYKQLNSNTTNCEIAGLSPANSYSIKVTYTYKTNYGTYTNYLAILYENDIKLAPVRVTGAKQERWYYYIKQIDAQWDRQKSISGYQYELRNAKDKVIKTGTTTNNYENYAYFKGIKNNTTYTMRVRGFTNFNGQTQYGAWSDTVYFIGQTPKITGKFKKSKLTVSWGKVEGATSYTVMVSTNPSAGFKGVKTIKASKKRKVTISKFGKKKFKKGKTYYVFIRTNKKVGTTTYTSNSDGSILYLGRARCK